MSTIQTVLSWFTNSKSNLLGGIKELVDEAFTSQEEKNAFLLKLKELEANAAESERSFELELKRMSLESERVNLEYEANADNQKADIMKSEMSSNDGFVRKARPTILYSGVALALSEVLGLRHLILSLGFKGDAAFVQVLQSSNDMLSTYLYVWAGVAGTYVVGRSFEKTGMSLPFFKKGGAQ